MGLDADVPEPPSLDDPQYPGDYDAVDEPEDATGDDYRRAELASFLAEGAWRDGFEEWAAHTLLTGEEFVLLLVLDLIDDLDFYWNPATGDVGYRVPPVPSRGELPSPYDDQFDSGDLDGIEEELDALARTVSEVLEAEYVGDGEAGSYGFVGEDEQEEEN